MAFASAISADDALNMVLVRLPDGSIQAQQIPFYRLRFGDKRQRRRYRRIQKIAERERKREDNDQ